MSHNKYTDKPVVDFWLALRCHAADRNLSLQMCGKPIQIDRSGQNAENKGCNVYCCVDVPNFKKICINGFMTNYVR